MHYDPYLTRTNGKIALPISHNILRLSQTCCRHNQ
jgi:hypothetical protein